MKGVQIAFVKDWYPEDEYPETLMVTFPAMRYLQQEKLIVPTDDWLLFHAEKPRLEIFEALKYIP